MIDLKAEGRYKLHLSVSYAMLKNLFPGNLYFIARDWLVDNSYASKMQISDFDLLYNKGEKEIIKGNERLLIRETHLNGFAISELEYELKKESEYLVKVVLVQDANRSWVTARFFTSPDIKRFYKTNSPNIIKIILNTGKGGRNGMIPISHKPITFGIEEFLEKSNELSKGLLIPMIVIKCNKSAEHVGLAYGVSKQLHGEASVLLVESSTIHLSNSELYIIYPDGSKWDFDVYSDKIYKEVIKEIRNNYNKQINILDFVGENALGFIPKKLDVIDCSYPKLVVFSILCNLTENEIIELGQVLAKRYDGSPEEFELNVGEIIKLPIHRNIIASLSNYEITELTNYIEINGLR